MKGLRSTARRTASGRAKSAGDRGYALGALLVAVAVMGVLTSMALPVWSRAAKREREAELIFRGEQYARAVALYQRAYAGDFPPDVDTLTDQRFLRRRYRDPMVEGGAFRILREADASGSPGAPIAVAPADGRRLAEALRGGVIGVVSTSDEAALRTYNGGAKYSEWIFVHDASPNGRAAGPADDGRPEDAPEPARAGSR